MALIELLSDLALIHSKCVDKLICQFEKLFDHCFQSFRKRLQQSNQQVDENSVESEKNINHQCKLDQIRLKFLDEIRNHFRKKFDEFLRQPETIEKLVIIGDYYTVKKVKENNDHELLTVRNEFREELQKLNETVNESVNVKRQYLEQIEDQVMKTAEEIPKIRNQLMVNLMNAINPNKMIFDEDNLCKMMNNKI
ncbi:hypothetical protein BLA29_002732 [Euroglyphus maynei]|uniref:Uncharacterized protein n=1 Tax=Euroglyphus maynei TaxID=6958 RepID=A0A1Y3BP45_EURMA|nr:hypothetical protein BLA29_002732 [Euroglyphus maynei]